MLVSKRLSTSIPYSLVLMPLFKVKSWALAVPYLIGAFLSVRARRGTFPPANPDPIQHTVAKGRLPSKARKTR